MSSQGVYKTALKSGKTSYRASLTHNGKHISLGSYEKEAVAAKAYKEACKILNAKKGTSFLFQYSTRCALSFEKWVIICNLRDNGYYFPTPIYMQKSFFSYWLSPDLELKFSLEDLFYYASHKISRRGGHLYVADYGSQLSLLSRYGIKRYGVCGRDYRFLNGDKNDLRYDNLEILNSYFGVQKEFSKGSVIYKARLHVKSNYLLGQYDTPIEAAIAYNKAVDLALKIAPHKNYPQNYIEEISPSLYADIYEKIKINTSFQKAL